MTPLKIALLFLIFFLPAFAEESEEESIASYSLSAPSYRCAPIQSAEFPRFECFEEKKPKRFTLMAPVVSKAMWDLHMSPYAGGEDLLFGARVLEKLETYMLGKSPIAYEKSAYARFWRLSDLVSIWLPLNYLAMVVQHEVFGHGYRIRDLSSRGLAEVGSYSFQAPPPYGPGGAATYFSVSDDFTTSEASAVSSGGVEGTAILALLTKLKWLSCRRIDPRQAVLYLLSEQDLTLYISTLKSKDAKTLAGHDINSYLETLNATYTEHFLSRGRLRSLSWINFADPFTFYSIYAWFRYISSGKETKIPMIASFYLPGLRLGLTPFGPEVFFENFFLQSKIPLYAYLKGGRHAGNTYLAAGVYAPLLWTVERWSFGLRGDIWRQPKLLLQPASVPFEEIDFHKKPNPKDPLYSNQEQHEMRIGASGSLITTFQGSDRIGYEAELGYKAQGFLPGYSLFAYPTVRLSFNLRF
jgi:hypothetical protein